MIASLLAWAVVVSQTLGVDPSTWQRLLSLPHATHHSEVRVDFDAARHRTRIWINTNEDDLRLWTIAGQQLDVEMRVSAYVSGRGGAWPDVISLEVASLGALRPVSGPQDLALTYDAQPLTLRQTMEPIATSGPLVFLTVKADIAIADLARLATATSVEGRVFGHRFKLVPSQLEILRAFVLACAPTERQP